MSFAAHAIVRCQLPVDPDFVVASGCHWGIYIRDAYPDQATEFDEQAASLGFCAKETGRMWSYLAKICIVTGAAPAELSAAQYLQARAALHEAVIAARGYRPQSLSTPLFGLDAVMFHRGQAPAPDIRRRWTGRPAPEVDWQALAGCGPQLAATMRRYLDQCALSLRPSSVHLFDTTLRQFAAHLLACDPPVTSAADIAREHIETSKTELATPARIPRQIPVEDDPGHADRPPAHLLLPDHRWDYEDVPARIPVYSTDRPRLDKPLPKFLDDAQAAAFMNAARQLPDPLDRLIVTVLARTGMRRGELLGLTVDSVVQICTGY